MNNKENLLKIYSESKYLQYMLEDNDINDIEDTENIENLCKQAHTLLNLNISYDTFIRYLINLANEYKYIPFNEINILQHVILSDYFQLDEQLNFIIEHYVFNLNVFYDKLYVYKPFNYYILNKFSKKNNISNATFKYIFNINKDICKKIKTLCSENIDNCSLKLCVNLIDLDISNNLKIDNVNYLNNFKLLENLNVSENCGVNQYGIYQLLFIKNLDINSNCKITDVNHLQQLEKLNASGKNCGVNQQGISNLINIIELNACDNDKISHVIHCDKCTKFIKFRNLKHVENKYNTTFDKKYYDIENDILNIFNNNCNNIDVNNYDLTNVLIVYSIGFYYQNISINYDEMKKWYLLAVDLNSSDAMHKLGYYHCNIEKKYNEMKKWYLMAINLNNLASMNNLGIHYTDIEHDYRNMKKYYLMAISYNYSISMFNLGRHYQCVEINYDEMKKWYLMAIDLNNANAMNNLGCYYKDIEKNYDDAKKYFLMAINLCYSCAYINILYMYDDVNKIRITDIELYTVLKNIKNKTEEFEKIYEELKNKPAVKNHIQKYDEFL